MEQQFAIGKNIRVVREVRGFSQEYVAKKIGISQRTYSNIEADKSKVDTEIIKNISEVLNIDPIQLMSLNEKTMFSNCTNSGTGNFGYMNTYQGMENDALKNHIQQLQKEVDFLKEEVVFLRGQLTK